MKIRNKILIYFSSTVIALTAISFIIIYILFSEYREEEFQQQQKEKITYTIKFLAEYKEMNENLADIMDELTIHDFYDEKMLIFDHNKNLVFSSLDDLPIASQSLILNSLSPSNRWVEMKEGTYDVVGIYFEDSRNQFYAISKAYDAFGYTKMFFLRNVLTGIFIATTIIVIIISLLLSNKISRPITALADHIHHYDLSSENASALAIETSSYEIKQLTHGFYELLNRTKEAFAFQKHTVHHISHQLKTPIAVLVSELEKIKHYTSLEDIKPELDSQIIKAKSLGSIINVLLEISKIESGQHITKQAIRIDEMIFDVIEELNIVYPGFNFEVNYVPDEIDENKLIIPLNEILVRQAFQNLLSNCIAYSSTSTAEVTLDCTPAQALIIRISNAGSPIAIEEEKFMFNHFFRGKNSQGKYGSGLGLVLTKKILELNSAAITYTTPAADVNVFEVRFSLS
jgi:two-component system, OmpR family, sensor histidine kinase ArlS